MKKVKVIKANKYDYVLEDNNKKQYNINIEFYDTEVNEGDIIFVDDKVLEETNLYAYGPLLEEANVEDLIKIVKDNKVIVKIGSVAHPMLEEHFIEWVALKTKFGNQRKQLKPGEEPVVCFPLCEGDEVEAVYAYCNLHGLWKA